MSERRRRLIERAFPLEEVSRHSRREKNIRQGHISTLHIWWARRPLAACRAFLYASLVDDPETEAEREALLREVADLASWDAVRHPERVVREEAEGGSGLTGATLLERARARILRDNGGEAPTLLDPFAGGGAIPLEGLRLGCEVEASDLNPVAVLILKGTLEYPQKYGQPNSRPVPDYIREADSGEAQPRLRGGTLAEEYQRNPLAADVRYWGNWMLERAREELARFYPPDPDGSVPVAYLWSRTIPCPSCQAEMPLIRQYWLVNKPKKRVALEPVIDRDAGRVDFRVVEGDDVTGNPGQAAVARGDARCLLCGQIVKAAQVRQAGMEGRMSAMMTAVVRTREGERGKTYRPDTSEDTKTLDAAASQLRILETEHTGDLPLIPDEPIDRKTLGLRVDAFGLTTWGDLFSERQLLALTTFARLTGEAHAVMLDHGLDADYATAVATYLGVAVDRQATRTSTLSFWNVGGETIEQLFARQALSMIWDFSESTPLLKSSGGFAHNLDVLIDAIEQQSFNAPPPPIVSQEEAGISRNRLFQNIVTDPPYYDSIDFAGLSDFFYVWLKRTIGEINPEILHLPLSPKSQQAIMASERGDRIERQRYLNLMAQAFEAIAASLEADGFTGIVFAHASPDAWATLIEGLLEAGLVPNTSWPIDTEIQSGLKVVGQARLKTSVWMACYKRGEDAGEAFLGDVQERMRPVIRERLLDFWGRGIRGADFFISAIGPALSVFGAHRRVLRPDGEEVPVREFLDIVRKESTTVALEQVLPGADLGVVDPITRLYVTWVWSYSRAALDAGEALALCLATGATRDEATRDHSIAKTAKEKSKKVVKLRTIAERAREDADLGATRARPALIDELQRAAWLWRQHESAELGKYRGDLGESRWEALRTLGQAIAECLPDGDEDRRAIHGLLSATVRVATAQSATAETVEQGTFTMEENDAAD